MPARTASQAGGGPGIQLNSLNWSKNLFKDADKYLTLAKYEKIQPGMTYKDVVTVLAIPPGIARPDEEMESVTPEAPVELTWHGGANPEQGPSITVKFKGKAVVGKSQKGLESPKGKS